MKRIRATWDLKTKEEQDAIRKGFAAAKTDYELRKLMGLTRVGYWVQKKGDPLEEDLLWPGDCIDLAWDPKQRAQVLEYVKQTSPASKLGYMGFSWCRLCKETQPPRDSQNHKLALWETLGTHDFGDGVFVWPEGYAHYIEVHGVKPPQYFIDHILAGGSIDGDDR